MIFMHCAFVKLEQAKITLVVVKFSDINLVITRRAQPHYECSFESGLR